MPSIPAWRRYSNGENWLEDRTVYVSLEPDSDGVHYRGGQVSLDRPKSGRIYQRPLRAIPGEAPNFDSASRRSTSRKVLAKCSSS